MALAKRPNGYLQSAVSTLVGGGQRPSRNPPAQSDAITSPSGPSRKIGSNSPGSLLKQAAISL